MPAPSSSIALFRGLLLASIGTALIGSMIDQQFTSLIPPTLQQAFKELPKPSDVVLMLSGLLTLITFGGTIGAIIGLYQFKPWSRELAVAMTLLQLLFYPLGGVWMQSGWTAMLLDLSSTLWGAVIAISYVSSLSHRFAAPVPPAR
jgi:hypothetical protein